MPDSSLQGANAPLGGAGLELKSSLQASLRGVRQDLLAKLDPLGEYDIRRPMTPTGTNLLGLVKHVGVVSLGYLSQVFGREAGVDVAAIMSDDEADLWVKASESRQSILDLYAHAAQVSDATIDALDLDSTGVVPWWPPDRRNVTLQVVLVHLIQEVSRHCGQADIIREMIDGQAGRFPGDPSLPQWNKDDWSAHCRRIEQAARAAA
ncbi:MAG: DinB family protein [Micrococcales bacterium]|nr:DinB family protein [Micrococcales bacterium]